MAANLPNSFGPREAEQVWTKLNQNPNQFSLKKLLESTAADRALPASTLYQFCDFIFEGKLPGGGRTNLNLILEEEVPLMGQPYSLWATGRYRQINHAFQDKILEISSRSSNIMEIPRKTYALKTRLWEGMIPVSGARWREKRFDDPRNWQGAFESLFEIIWVFNLLGDPACQMVIRNAFNSVSRELSNFQGALNTRRSERGLVYLNLTGLWTEFMKAHFETMITRTHSWVLARYNEFLDKAKDDFEANTAQDGSDELYDVAKKFTDSTQDFQKLISKADYYMFMPMTGFHGYDPNSASLFSQVSLPERDEMYYAKADRFPWTAYRKLLENQEKGFRSRETVLGVFNEGRSLRDQLRADIRGEPKKLGDQKWINILKSRIDWSLEHGGPRDQTWGFVAYRLDYTHTSDEWEHFIKILNEDFGRSGEWIDGAEDIRDRAGLQWLNGQELGIAENDFQGARRHFETFRGTNTMKRRMWKQDFLIADHESVSYYLKQNSNPPISDMEPYGDYGGYLKLVDAGAPLNLERDQAIIGPAAPGYRGLVKVLGSLVFDDVYPMIASLAARPRDFWLQAVLHPMQVYVGLTVPMQEQLWEDIRKARAEYLTQVLKVLGRKQAEE